MTGSNSYQQLTMLESSTRSFKSHHKTGYLFPIWPPVAGPKLQHFPCNTTSYLDPC